MSLLRPTTSDIWDRMIVLLLKIEHAAKAGKPTAHFQQEYRELADVARSKPVPEKEHLDGLRELHAAIWDGIDLMMSKPAITDKNARTLARTAINLQVWNTERVRIKHEIDKATMEYVGEEKV